MGDVSFSLVSRFGSRLRVEAGGVEGRKQIEADPDVALHNHGASDAGVVLFRQLFQQRWLRIRCCRYRNRICLTLADGTSCTRARSRFECGPDPQRDFVTVARVLHSISQYYLAMP